MPTCAPLSSQRQIFNGTVYRYRPEQYAIGIKTCTAHQLDPEATSPDQKHLACTSNGLSRYILR